MPTVRARYAALAAAAIFVAGCSSQNTEQAVQKESPIKGARPAPAFSLKDADGRTVNLADYRGKVVLLNFWATWCGPCKIEIPWFIEFEQKYRDKGFAVLGVSMDEDGWSVVKPYVAAAKVNYRVLLGNDEVAQQYGGVDSLPTSFVIDRNGQIVAQHVGLVTKSDFEDDIVKTLGGGRTARGFDLRASRGADR